jgi:hypothetical protein
VFHFDKRKFSFQLRPRACSLELYQLNQQCFFFHNKSTNNTFCHDLSAPKKNSGLFFRYSAAIAGYLKRRDDISHFPAISAISAIFRYSAAKLLYRLSAAIFR